MSDHDPSGPSCNGNERDGRGRFGPGNTAGRERPEGSRPKALAHLDALGLERAEAIVQALALRAEAGDVQAAGLLLARIWPARKARPISLDLPAVTDATTARAALTRITEATAAGELAPDEALALAELVRGQLQAYEMDELDARLRALEGRA